MRARRALLRMMHSLAVALSMVLPLVAGLPCMCRRPAPKIETRSCCCGHPPAAQPAQTPAPQKCCCTALAKADLTADLPAMDMPIEAIAISGLPDALPAGSEFTLSSAEGPGPPEEPALYLRLASLRL